MTKVDKNMLIGEIVQKHPQSARVMMSHGLHCIGCHVATWETLAQGAQSHGIDIDRLVEGINKVIENEGDDN